MVDLVKIRKKAKEKSEDGGQRPDTAVAIEPTPAPAETPKPKKQASKGEQARSAPAGPPVAEPQTPAADHQESPQTAPELPAPTSDLRPPASEVRPPDAPAPVAASSAKSMSKLERYKEQAGKRREKAENIGRTAAAELTAGEGQLELLTFAIAGESYAIEIENIVEIVPPRAATRVPNATASVVGIMSLRGTIVTLIDVRRRLKHSTAEPTVDTRIIVLEHEGETVGFEVDRVFRVVKIAATEVEPHPVVHASEQDESIRGVFRHGESLTILLDFAKLLGGREVARTGPREAAAVSRR